MGLCGCRREFSLGGLMWRRIGVGFVVAMAGVWLAGCVSPHSPVRRVETNEVGNVGELAAVARRIAESDYYAAEYPECPQCTISSPLYTDGYECAAALLRYIAERYDAQAVPKLHARLVRGEYSDEFFSSLTGKPLETLWQEFEETPRFTADAALGLKIREQLKEARTNTVGMPEFFKEFLRSRRGGALGERKSLPGPAEEPSSVTLSQLSLASRQFARWICSTRRIRRFVTGTSCGRNPSNLNGSWWRRGGWIIGRVRCWRSGAQGNVPSQLILYESIGRV